MLAHFYARVDWPQAVEEIAASRTRTYTYIHTHSSLCDMYHNSVLTSDVGNILLLM